MLAPDTTPSYDYVPQTLEGRTALVTGGTTGIGRSTAQRLVLAGARVLIFGRHDAELQDTLRDLHSLDRGEAFGLTADQSKPDDLQRVFEQVDHQLGGLDILVNNAALGGGGIVDTDLDEVQYLLQTNLFGYLACAKYAVTRMKRQGGGHIVNVGSMSANTREGSSSVYVAAKAGVQAFSESLRKEVNPDGIKVTLIEPGAVGTDMQASKVPPEEQPQKQAAGEMLKAEDIAESVYYALTQPAHCDVIVLQIRPHQQFI